MPDNTQRSEHDAPPFRGSIGLACGHTWEGECPTRDEAEAFLAACVATGDTVRCGACSNAPSAVTGPLRERSSATCGSCFLGECGDHAGAPHIARSGVSDG